MGKLKIIIDGLAVLACMYYYSRNMRGGNRRHIPCNIPIPGRCGNKKLRPCRHPLIMTSIILNLSTALSACGFPAGMTIMPPLLSR